MGLSVGIVGLANVGKSTLFNALLKKQQAYVANFPFATIEPNIGVVPVPDVRLNELAKIYRAPIVPATVEFVDIAGLIAGAAEGAGLGNKFLSHIRETDAICHVVRAFKDPDIVKQGVADPKSDLEVVQTELALADLQTLEKQKDPGNTPDKDLQVRWTTILKLKSTLGSSSTVRTVELTQEERAVVKELGLLSFKPYLVVLNVGEADLKNADSLEREFAGHAGLSVNQVIAICAKTEAQLAELSDEEAKQYLTDLGVENSGLERVIKKAFATLGLITYLTAGEKEVRAWVIKGGMDAQHAAGVIHTDFEKNFIKADVIEFDDFVAVGGWKNARELGKVRSEGREYVVKDGDIVEFKIGT